MSLPFLFVGGMMSVFLFKSVLSLFMLLSAFIAMFTMFEIFGRAEKRYNIENLKKLHRANGIIYLLFFVFITYFCLDFILQTKAEPSPRSTFHSLFSLTVIILLGLKVSFVRLYRQYYGRVQTIGILIALLTFGMIWTSGGHFLLVTKFGTDMAVAKIIEQKKETPNKIAKIAIKTDSESIKKGKEMYESKCYFCHDAYSTKTGVGPGHKGILKNPTLPVSKKPATPENVANQIKNPYRDMPSFSYLPDEDVQNMIAFLNTL